MTPRHQGASGGKGGRVRTAREVTLPLHVDRAAAEPLPAQLVAQLRGLLASGVLRPGDDLPSTRALAAHLGVARGTVVTAYEQLLAEGWFSGAAGRSTTVNPRLHEVHPRLPVAGEAADPRAARAATAAPAPTTSAAGRPRPPLDLRPGQPTQTGVVGPAWRSAWRRAADAPVEVPLPPLGWPPLRAAIADHLRRMRAVVRDPAEIVVTAGVREGLALLLMATGARTVGVEEPGYPSLRRVLTAFGARPVPLPADAQGLVTASLPAAAPQAVIVTPSHQYPLGGSLPVDRRLQLLDWAAAHGTLVVEDDYDSELRYTSAPLPALTSLDHRGGVALLGTFAKTLTPAVAVGFVVVPPALLGAVEAVRGGLGQPVSLVTQRALAHYLDSGALMRHTQRMRHLYRRRRAQVVRALRAVPGARVYPMDGGLHAVVEHERDEPEVLAALAARGVLVAALSDYWAGGGSRRGLVFGFGGVSDADLAAALTAIAAVLAEGA
nr:PLP-dependent aminotransferase family protein [Propionibacterium sp.]